MNYKDKTPKKILDKPYIINSDGTIRILEKK